ncbi:MAG: hypothetical protein DRJ32_01495 [Thermoprotei archaeon]|nr:MAG: hypothetical protein B6U94_00860 [Thermofilum sp. ex4484_79]RLE61310.1 MAG: hypothetical protein DRJ32_01495 [Thermoprotei archaeon]
MSIHKIPIPRNSKVVLDKAEEIESELSLEEIKELIRRLGGDPSFIDKLETEIEKINNEISELERKIQSLKITRNKLLKLRKRLIGIS